MADQYTRWCRTRGVTHAHCPRGCEHPQPVAVGDRLLCGRCLILFGEEVECLPCGPETCPADIKGGVE